MEGSIKSNFKSAYKILGIYQIIGGTIGLILLCSFLYNQGWSAVQLLAIDIIFVLFCVYSLVCGVLCIKLNDIALSLSLVNQVLQLLSFGFGSFMYTYVSGVNFSITLDFTNELNMGLDFGISKMLLQFNSQKELTFIHINLVSLAIVILIDRTQQKIKNFYKLK